MVLVGVVMGSKSDAEAVRPTLEIDRPTGADAPPLSGRSPDRRPRDRPQTVAEESGSRR